MAGQPAGQQENGVDADVVTGPGKTGRKPLGRNGHPPQPILIERHGGAILASARLDLDESDNPTAARDQVDLAAGHSRALGQDPPAMETQPPGRQPLGLAPAPLGKLAPVQRLSSRARA
jgi:hypothetical protein